MNAGLQRLQRSIAQADPGARRSRNRPRRRANRWPRRCRQSIIVGPHPVENVETERARRPCRSGSSSSSFVDGRAPSSRSPSRMLQIGVALQREHEKARQHARRSAPKSASRGGDLAPVERPANCRSPRVVRQVLAIASASVETALVEVEAIEADQHRRHGRARAPRLEQMAARRRRPDDRPARLRADGARLPAAVRRRARRGRKVLRRRIASRRRHLPRT